MYILYPPRSAVKSCKCHKLCPNSDKLPHQNRSRVSHAYYIVSASLEVHWYTSRTCPESLSNCHGRPRWIQNVHICISYALAYWKYLNKYLFTAYVTANVKYANAFACMTYLHKIVVFHIFDSTCHKQICRPQISYVNMSHMHMYWHILHLR